MSTPTPLVVFLLTSVHYREPPQPAFLFAFMFLGVTPRFCQHYMAGVQEAGQRRPGAVELAPSAHALHCMFALQQASKRNGRVAEPAPLQTWLLRWTPSDLAGHAKCELGLPAAARAPLRLERGGAWQLMRACCKAELLAAEGLFPSSRRQQRN